MFSRADPEQYQNVTERHGNVIERSLEHFIYRKRSNDKVKKGTERNRTIKSIRSRASCIVPVHSKTFSFMERSKIIVFKIACDDTNAVK